MKYQIMPPLSKEEYEALKADIKENGVQVPVEYDEDGNVLDGYNRVQICNELGIKDFPYFIRRGLTEEEKFAHARRLNIARRHLTQEQKRELIRGQLKETPEKSDRQIARALGASQPTVSMVRKEMEESGELIKSISSIGADGKERPRQVERKPAPPIYGTNEKQKEAITTILDRAEEGDEDAEKWVDKLSKGQATIHSAQKRTSQKKETEAPPLPQGQYEVILADPPWRYEFSETSMRAIENQYPSMDLEDIKKLDIPAADNSALFLWATAPKLEEALQVLNAWGFAYKTCAVWDKEKMGMGYWFRGQHELLLVGVKGHFKTPEPKNRFPSVIREARSQHSSKPQVLYSMIEKMFPEANYVELFARNNRQGWDSWGNEA